ncbi:PepSY domain-containing protein [Streptomyces mirabilis]|uniref:PepSY domain-containing protein n=1 Tax=Streptomyces mirabilis TaxID=68239 RepID=UPI000765947E|nr:PepSY domain-containing protein [Streptomyces mirabilis]
MKRTSMIVLTAGALAVTLTGTALAGGGSHDVPPSRNASSVATATPTAPPTTPSMPVSSSRAAEIAVGHIGGGQVIEVETEVEHGRTAWSVKILKSGSQHKVYVDRSNGRIMRAEQESAGPDRGGATDDRRDDHHGGSDDDGGDTHGRHHH